MTALTEGGPGVSGWLRGWALWSLPRRAVHYVVCVDICAMVAFVLAWRISEVQSGDLLRFAVLSGCALISVEASRQLGSYPARHDRPYKDMLSAWLLPAALLLPPSLAMLIPVLLYPALQYRVKRLPAVKRTFNTASTALALFLAHLVHSAVAGSTASLTPADLMGSGRAFASVVVAAVLVSGVAAVLVAGVLRRVAGTTWPEALGAWRLQATEPAELSLGMLVALAAASSPLLAVLALPPMLLLQRTLLHAELQEAARTDAKTGLANPEHWRQVAEREVARARRGRHDLAVLLVDIDRFKLVNDHHGHLVGDRVLAAVAGELKAAVRPRDLVGRFGGEEFVLLLTDASPAVTAATADRLRVKVEQLPHHVTGVGQLTGDPASHHEPAPLRVTVSVGVATLGVAAQDLTGLLESADAALYAAKSAGRNRVHTALPSSAALAPQR